MKSKITSWGFPFSMIKLQADWVGRKERRQIHNIFNTEERGERENETNESHHIWDNGTQLSLC